MNLTASVMETMDLSLIIPVHNEEPILDRNIRLMYGYLEGLRFLDSFEIILACNGCTDRSEEISLELHKTLPAVKYISIEGRGLGTAIHESVHRASYEMMMFYAVDLPFGLDVIGRSVEASAENGGSVVVGSKAHPGSTVERSAARWLFSSTISVLNNLFFGLGVKDTQGSILFYKEPFRRFDRFMDNSGAFFQTQILIYSRRAGFDLVEIPVELKKEMRKTRFSLASDGLGYVSSIFREKLKLVRSVG